MASVFVIVGSLPVFRGDPGECPDAHLRRLDRLCRATGDATSATAARIFPASLDGDAAEWYDLIADAAGVKSSSPAPPPWDAVRTAFLDVFRHPDAADRARGEIKGLRQGPDETVYRYHLRMLGILRQILDGGGADVPDAVLKDAFVGGLRAEFKEWVTAPSELDEAVALALSWEGAEGLRAARRAAKEACGSSSAAALKCAFCGMEGHEEARCEVGTRMSELWGSGSINIVGGGGAAAAMAAKDGEETDEEEGSGSKKTMARIGSAVSTRSTCRCRKHQCSKKAVVAASDVAGGGCGEGNGVAAAGQVTEAFSFNLMDL